MKKVLLWALVALSFCACKKEKRVLTADFEDLGLQAESYWHGTENGETTFTSRDFTFTHYNTEWGSWNQFAYSNVTATDFDAANYAEHQYRNVVGKGAENTKTFGVGFDAGEFGTPRIKVNASLAPDGVTMDYVYVTNAAYTVSTMEKGDAYGNEAFKQGDWALLEIRGIQANGDVNKIDVYLADFRSENASEHYIVKDWKKVNLGALGKVKELVFNVSSSRVNEYGNLLPAYFCIDQLKSMEIEVEK